PALARLDRPGAGRATDAGIAFVVQRVVRQLARADVLPHLLFAPVEERTDFVKPVPVVPLEGLALRARGRLLPPHARHPGPITRDGAFERLDLAHAAAGHARLEAVIKTIDALRRNQRFHLSGFGIDEADAFLVTQLQLLEQIISLRVQPPRID